MSSVDRHVRDFFSGHEVSYCYWTLGPILEVLPRFRVLRVAPGKKSNLWIYVSDGASEVTSADFPSMEFMIFAPEESSRHVELLAMSAHYHLNYSLGRGHTYPIGEPWLPESNCDHMLVSLPYPFGEDLEICGDGESHVHLFWLLPITKAERDFKKENGLELLEQIFEEREIEYWRADRESLV